MIGLYVQLLRAGAITLMTALIRALFRTGVRV